jgi:branched-subunit amino acid aminotransferase/4-amino-4-deoxychorismate lyase
MGPEFFQTMMGRKFFDGDVPRLIKAIERLAHAVETINLPKEIDKAALLKAVTKPKEERKATYVPNVGFSSHDVIGEEKAALIIGDLVKESMFFQVTPLPDDRWEFTVKSEEFDRLTSIISKEWP